MLEYRPMRSTKMPQMNACLIFLSLALAPQECKVDHITPAHSPAPNAENMFPNSGAGNRQPAIYLCTDSSPCILENPSSCCNAGATRANACA